MIQQVLKTQESHKIEYGLEIAGKELWFSTIISPLDRESVLWVARNISDRKQLELDLQLSESKLNDILNSATAAISRLIVKQDGTWASDYISNGCEIISGYTAAELYADPSLWLSRFHPQDWQAVEAQVYADIFAERSGTYIYRLCHKNGSWRWISQRNHSRWDAWQNAWVVTVISSDISDRKQAEIDLAKAKEKAEAATIAKSAFLANMSHEIRTPMNGVIGIADLLAESDLTPEHQELVQIIKYSGNALLIIINDILDFSKIESGMLTLEAREFALGDILVSVYKLLNNQASEKQITLSYTLSSMPQTFLGDSARLQQILLNLVGNAIKFTENGNVSIIVSTKLLDRASNQYELRFIIKDTGIGINPDLFQQLFQPFTQADASISRKYGGTGLGLAICKRLVELMNGTIWVESYGHIGGSPPPDWQPENTQGSAFHFAIALPSNIKTTQTQPSVSLPKIDYRIAEKYPLRILLAEDNPVNQKVTKFALKKLGYEIDIANNGLEALNAAESKIYDLILMDVQMPEMDGLTATKLIRKNLEKQPWIVAITANAMPEDRQACLQVGMNDYIAKPFNIEEIIQIISRLSQV